MRRSSCTGDEDPGEGAQGALDPVARPASSAEVDPSARLERRESVETVPSGGIGASANAEQAVRVALSAAGPRGTWRWARNAIPIVGLVCVSESFGAWRLTFELEPGLLVSVNRDSSRASVVGTAEVALRWTNVSPYAALSCVASTRALDGRDFAQTGGALGVRHELSAFYSWTEARLQLDGPAGVAEPRATFWGVTFGSGARL